MARALVRLGGFVVGGMVPGMAAVVIVRAAVGPGGYPGWLFVALAAVVGVGCWLGFTFRAGASDVALSGRWSGGLAGRGALAFVLGLGGGAVALVLGAALASQGFAGAYAVLAWLALVAGTCGIVAGRAARRSIPVNATEGALYGLLCGFGIPLGLALVEAVRSRACPPRAFCLVLDPARALMTGAQIGAVVGVWLACVIWCSIGLGLSLTTDGAHRRERPDSPTLGA